MFAADGLGHVTVQTLKGQTNGFPDILLIMQFAISFRSPLAALAMNIEPRNSSVRFLPSVPAMRSLVD
jgi:hypothetical protein